MVPQSLFRRLLAVLTLAGAYSLGGATLAAQSAASSATPLSLRDAVARADARAYANRIATASADAQSAQALAPYRGILPTLRAEAGFVRTTDPIAAFGTKLRQRAITPADFNPATLNFPAAIGNRSAGLVIEQPLLNADAWVGRAAAGDAAKAQRAAAAWTRGSTRTDVVRAYYGATLAAEKSATLSVGERAAFAHVARAKALADTGLVTRSDALLAEVKAGEISAQRIAAAGDAAHARRALAVLLGEPNSTYQLPTALPESDAIRALVAADTSDLEMTDRADVRAATLALSAARADAWRAKSLYLPRLNGFARYDWNDPTGFFANARSWTAGVMASWSPFSGGSELSEIRGTAARERSARAQREAATAQAELARAETREKLAVALAQLSIAERAVAQATEAHRIVARKYDGGLATISELLEASAIETQTRLGFSFARYTVLVTAAERRHALGNDPAFLVALDAPTSSPDRASR
ncbi:MAG: TolC family protein [Gemmatimonadaceae bacterium]|nr:TolC family protein [Gemmatimonadaceae bacterium]